MPAVIRIGVNTSIPGCGMNNHQATKSCAITCEILDSILMPTKLTQWRMATHSKSITIRLARAPLRLRMKVGDIKVPSKRLPAITRNRLTQAANRQP